jgi:hypothetical protein
MVLHLAYSSSSSGGGWSWIPISIVEAAIPILCPILVRRMRKIRGPVVEGTAEVLSLRQFGSVAVNGPARMICRLRLRVSVLGQEPYDVTVWRNIAPWDLGAFQKGSTVALSTPPTRHIDSSWIGTRPGHDFASVRYRCFCTNSIDSR